MNKQLRRGLLCFGLFTLAGCGDNADVLLRAGINQKSELTDRLMKVTDEESAKKFLGYTLKNYVETNRQLDERWQKWTKDIEDDMPKKSRINIAKFKSAGAPGSEEWEKDALNVPPSDDARALQTREAFIVYMRKVSADTNRFNREKARIANILNHLAAEKINAEKANGVENPDVDAKALWPNLAMINQPETFRTLLLSGAQ